MNVGSPYSSFDAAALYSAEPASILLSIPSKSWSGLKKGSTLFENILASTSTPTFPEVEFRPKPPDASEATVPPVRLCSSAHCVVGAGAVRIDLKDVLQAELKFTHGSRRRDAAERTWGVGTRRGRVPVRVIGKVKAFEAEL
jgi:hypothetical protein